MNSAIAIHLTHHLASANVVYLEQAADLLATLSDAEYLHVAEPLFTQGLGAHIRHILDHYTSLIVGLASGMVDYDARARKTSLEQNRVEAMDAVKATIYQLQQISDVEAARCIQVVMDCGGSETLGRSPGESSVARELQFLVSHTVHHYAIVAVMLKSMSHPPPQGFGVAPSTLRHLEQS